MKKVLVLVEGKTERDLISRVLAPHFSKRDIWLQPKILTTKRTKAGPDFMGGVTTYQRAKDDVRRLLADTSLACVTTMLDFYALPRDFPGWDDMPAGGARARVEHLEAAWRRDVAASGFDPRSRFDPHLVLHETEALIFADPMACDLAFPDLRHREALVDVRRRFASPEDIDEGPETAPSKRILHVVPGYKKASLGPLAIEEIGLDVIRSQCPHFDGWLRRIEALARP